MNILLAAAYMIATFAITLLAYKFFGKEGLYIWISISIIISNIQSVKIIELFGITTILGNIAYSSIYLATDILAEQYGKRAANKSITYGFISMIIFSLLMCYALFYIPSVHDYTQESLCVVFKIIPRICIASLIAFMTSQYLDVYLFMAIKKKYDKLWLSNNGGTIPSQLIDTIVFIAIGYGGSVPFKELFSLGVTMYLLKVIIAICDTGFLYLAKKIKVKEE